MVRISTIVAYCGPSSIVKSMTIDNFMPSIPQPHQDLNLFEIALSVMQYCSSVTKDIFVFAVLFCEDVSYFHLDNYKH